MNMPDLQEAQDYAYELIISKYGIKFSKPSYRVITPDQFMDNFRTITSMKQMFEPIPNMFIHPEKGMHVIYDPQNAPSNPALHFSFMHELGHCLQTELNPELNSGYVFSIIDYDDKEREKGVVLFTFNEGMAELIAVESALNSSDLELQLFAHSHSQDRLDSVDEFLRHELDLLSYAYKMDRKKPGQILARFMTKNQGLTMEFNAHNFGYRFAYQHQDMGLRKMILTPPHTYNEFCIPEEYKAKVNGKNE